MEKLLKQLAGEYAVAKELCRRGIYPLLTHAKYSDTDIIIEKDGKCIKIQVKTKFEKEWSNIKWGENDFIVFVDMEEDKEDFYILTQKDWIEFLHLKYEQELIEGKLIIIKNEPIWPLQIKNDGTPYCGIDIMPKEIIIHKNMWDKIESIIFPKASTKEPTRIGKITPVIKNLKITKI